MLVLRVHQKGQANTAKALFMAERGEVRPRLLTVYHELVRIVSFQAGLDKCRKSVLREPAQCSSGIVCICVQPASECVPMGEHGVNVIIISAQPQAAQQTSIKTQDGGLICR